jgi:hypothetical protein
MSHLSSRCREWFASLWLCVASVGLATAPAYAQCGRDGLDAGPCCTPSQAILPPFPAVSTSVKYLCWDECRARINRDICIDLGVPTPLQQGGALVCSVYRIPVTVKTCGTAARVLWTANLTAHYSRNWLEAPVAGAPPTIGVWRFILNGDIRPSAFVLQRYGTNRCAVPACFALFNAIYVQGYIDYAFDCQNGRWLVAGAFDHGCDAITHGPASARPAPAGGFDPGRSYTWVFPAAGFVPYSSTAPAPRSNGPINPGQEAFRKNDWTTAPAICRNEEPVGQGFLNAISEFCLCTVTGLGTNQFVNTAVQVFGQCGTQLFTGTAGGPIPFVQKRIGMWTNGAVFPGNEYLLLDMGNAQYIDGCTTTTFFEYFEGVETIGGFPAFTYTLLPLNLQFEDWASSDRPIVPPAPLMIIGVPHISWFIVNLNI